MSDRSDEATESRDPEDVLAETERLLSETDAGTESGDSGISSEPQDPGPGTGIEGAEPLETDAATGSRLGSDDAAEPDPDTGSSRLSGLRSGLSRVGSWLSVDDYFSPRTFLLFVLAVGAGLFGGGMVLPLGTIGRAVGMFGVAFALGLVLSTRRYLEMTTAGAVVGGASALASHAVLAVAGSFRAVVAVGVGVGLVASLLGYYFGRDLRNGLSQDVE